MNAEQYDENLDNYNWLAGEVDKHETEQSRALGELLYDKLSPRSVIDIGCSSGIYLVPYMEHGVEVYGVDGAHGVGQHIPGKFEVVDLRNLWTPNRNFDLAICIETGEHLRPQYHSGLVETISKCAPTVFWSAARPGQGGEGHTGEAMPQYWADLFEKFGYSRHILNDQIVASINTNSVYDHCGWLKSNSILFQKQ